MYFYVFLFALNVIFQIVFTTIFLKIFLELLWVHKLMKTRITQITIKKLDLTLVLTMRYWKLLGFTHALS